MLWFGDWVWWQVGECCMFCGLQLFGLNNQQFVFKGKVVDIDQFKVWLVGICLGIDVIINQLIDVLVDCVVLYVMEVFGMVNLVERFFDVLLSEFEQDGFIKDVCIWMMDVYFVFFKLCIIILMLIYFMLMLFSWLVGSCVVVCSIGVILGNGGWVILVNSVKGVLLINGQLLVFLFDIFEEWFNLLLILFQLLMFWFVFLVQQLLSILLGIQYFFV